MWAILLGLLLVARADWSRGQNITFDGDIRAYIVGSRWLYVLTDDQLLQVSHDLALIQGRIFHRGTLLENDTFQRVLNSDRPAGNAIFKVNILLPFIKNNTLITCGRIECGSCGKKQCGYCDVLDLDDISRSVYSEKILVGSLNGSSVVFLVDVKGKKTETYILAAYRPFEKGCQPDTQDKMITLQNTNDGQTGDVFSWSDAQNDRSAYMTSRHNDVEFVDGFQIDQHIYLFSNMLKSRVKLNWLTATTNKFSTYNSLQAATLDCCEDRGRPRLLASSVIPGGPPVFWAGVFTGSDTNDPLNTVLAIFDISPKVGDDPDFCSNTFCNKGKQPIPTLAPDKIKHLKPVAVVFKDNSMTSVLAVKQGSWVVFFVGTADGQLIKLAVDKNFTSTCPRVLHRSDNDQQVFPKMHLDPVDPKHLYMGLRNQMKRVSVAECGAYSGLEGCWSAQDPFCGWCDTKDSPRCTFRDECKDSSWFSILDESSQQSMISHQLEINSTGQNVTLTVQVHLSATGSPAFACNFLVTTGSDVLCDGGSPPPLFPRCFCQFSRDRLPAQGLHVAVRVRVGHQELTKSLALKDCSGFSGPVTFDLCSQCVSAGCSWKSPTCSWSPGSGLPRGDDCKMDPPAAHSAPKIVSIQPSELSFHGWNHALMTGNNLGHVTMVRIQSDFDCTPKESPVWNNTGSSLTFHIPSGHKGLVRVCVVLPGGGCHGNATVTYQSLPTCTGLAPTTTWAGGMRKIVVTGSRLEFVDGVIHGHAPHTAISTNYTNGSLLYFTPEYTPPLTKSFTSDVLLRVANHTVRCKAVFAYHPNPEFTSFTSVSIGNDLRITIEKKADKLNITKGELSVLGVQGREQHVCDMRAIETRTATDSVTCDIRNIPNTKINALKIKYGNCTVDLTLPEKQQFIALLVLLLIVPFIILAVVFIYRNKQKKLTDQMNQRLELLESDIRQEIRQGFVDMQTDNLFDLTENVGAIPFLDYKHFASRIFFPEGGPVTTSCIKDIGQNVVALDESCQALSALIRDQQFLTSMVHALEEQKNFSIKDKCMVASLLSVALHGDLPYLTTVMESLLGALMDQHSSSQPKLMLRRTESIVEKILTNWMSMCLYGFLRESVGQHLFLLVSALTQQMSKGPVDSVTEKALYTLNEDWLLWQAQDFSPVKLKVLFAVGTDEEVSDPLEVHALSCDTVDQVKEKILLAFRTKFGFPYNSPLRDVHIEYDQGGSYVGLEEVDSSSEVMGDVTMLNTLRHYKVPDGASIKVLSRTTHRPLSPQGSLKDDQNFSTKYFHLIDPEVDQDQRQNPERKKLKLKEVHLTKLLSTKVAVHSFVENLFRTIWGTANGRAPHAVKYFFDFLDAQAETKRIMDQDVTHIWKTNSLPLRFWVNILKNPQFVFDMEKTPYLEGCLNVIAQAFMDSFSLSDTQMGKHAPTNKLLYAKDIPQYKQEVKSYYKQVRDQPPITSSEFKDFLLEESKKHENEFNESAALRELYKYMERYFDEIKQKLDQNGAPADLQEQLQHVKDLFHDLRSCSWN